MYKNTENIATENAWEMQDTKTGQCHFKHKQLQYILKPG